MTSDTTEGNTTAPAEMCLELCTWFGNVSVNVFL